MSGLRKRSLAIAGHRTSVSLEEPFWEALKEIAAAERRPVASLVMEVDSGRGELNLSSALRLRVLAHYRGRTEAAKVTPAD
jgi:predicted DNA-binding ribbon-helix-helix protein